MFRVYINDGSFYDVVFAGVSLSEFLDFGLNSICELVILPSTSGDVAVNKSAIVKIIKL